MHAIRVNWLSGVLRRLGSRLEQLIGMGARITFLAKNQFGLFGGRGPALFKKSVSLPFQSSVKEPKRLFPSQQRRELKAFSFKNSRVGMLVALPRCPIHSSWALSEAVWSSLKYCQSSCMYVYWVGVARRAPYGYISSLCKQKENLKTPRSMCLPRIQTLKGPFTRGELQAFTLKIQTDHK